MKNILTIFLIYMINRAILFLLEQYRNPSLLEKKTAELAVQVTGNPHLKTLSQQPKRESDIDGALNWRKRPGHYPFLQSSSLNLNFSANNLKRSRQIKYQPDNSVCEFKHGMLCMAHIAKKKQNKSDIILSVQMFTCFYMYFHSYPP